MHPSTNRLPPAARMFQWISGSFATPAIHAAAALGIADLLRNGPRRVEELADASGAHAPSLYRLLRALASVRIFAEESYGRFRLTPMAQTLQTGGDLREMALMQRHAPGAQPWGDLLESVHTGRPSFEQQNGARFFDYLTRSPGEAARFQAGMTGASAQDAPHLLAAYDFSVFAHVTDVGGGQGGFLAAVLAAHPALAGTLFDLPEVVADPSPIHDPTVAARRTVGGGDFFTGVPPGADATLLKAVLHDWSDENAVRILRHCREALSNSTSARVLVFEMVIPGGNGPHPGKFMDLSLLVLTEGRERTREEFRALFGAAGLRLRRVVRTGCALSILEAAPAREEMRRRG